MRDLAASWYLARIAIAFAVDGESFVTGVETLARRSQRLSDSKRAR